MKKIGLFLVFSLGLIFSISAQEYTPAKNWFVGAGVNADWYLNHTWREYSEYLKKPTIGGEAFVGKWFSNKVGARLALQAGSVKPWFYLDEDKKGSPVGQFFTEDYALARLEFMLNLTNCWRSYSPNRFFNLIPHIGVGGAYAFGGDLKGSGAFDGKDTYLNYAISGGLMGTFRLADIVSLYIDLKGDLVNHKFDGDGSGKGFKRSFNGIASPSIGLVFNLGPKSQLVAPVAPPVVETAAVVEPPKPVEQPKPVETPKPVEQPKPVVVPAPVIPAFTPANVFFRIGKSIVDADQQASIANTAKYMNNNPTTKVKVVGYADKGTGSAALNLKLSEQRAKAVAKVLVDKYKISSDRISVDWKGDTVQPFDTAKKNRVAMILGN